MSAKVEEGLMPEPCAQHTALRDEIKAFHEQQQGHYNSISLRLDYLEGLLETAVGICKWRERVDAF